MVRPATFWHQKGSEDEAKMRLKTDQNRRQKRSRKKMLLRSSWSRLGSILAHLGGRRGVIFIDFVLVFILFRDKRGF